MLQKHSSTKICSSLTPEEIEELRRSLQTSKVAEIDAFMFGNRFSQIISHGRNPKEDVPLKRIGDLADTAA
jgi:hypothetical protein